MPEPLVEITRAGEVEAIHRGDIVVSDGDGRVCAALGDTGKHTYTRSAIKSWQALALFTLWPEARGMFTPEERGVMLASHNGEEKHVEAVRSILRKAGLTEDLLQCGPHPPHFTEAQYELARRGETPKPIHNNCSGKHSAMLSLCKHMGWDFDTYRDPDHQIQVEIRRIISRLSGTDAEKYHRGIDGCSLPTYYMPLNALARGFARLTTPGKYFSDDENFLEGCRLVVGTFHPGAYYIGGTGRFCTALNSAGEGRFLGKVGAEGLYLLGIPGKDMGIAVKLNDGDKSSRAYGPVVVEVLNQLGILTDDDRRNLSDYINAPLYNWNKIETGRISCIFKLKRAG